jgi:hypothetical protein
MRTLTGFEWFPLHFNKKEKEKESNGNLLLLELEE